MGILSRVLSPFRAKATEGEYRTGPWLLPITGGFLPADAPLNWWQTGADPLSYSGYTAMVEGCVSAYAQTIAMCPGSHWRSDGKGGRTRVTNSALSRVLKKPNSYQSISDFMLNLVRSLYQEGNVYVLALRNSRFEVTELHLMDARSCGYRIGPEGEVFYDLGGNDIVDRLIGGPIVVPSRDVLHIRLHTPRHPLRGETPLVAAALDVAATNAIMRQQVAFYVNQARPSAVLSTDQILTAEQVQVLRERWNEHSQGLNSGKTPILTAGLKAQPLSTTAVDAQLAEMLKMSAQHIALAFRVPLQILTESSSTYSSTESLMGFWKASGLGFALNHIEEAFGGLFGLSGYPDEYVEFDTDALLRSAMKDRMEALARGVQGGIYAPNEARALEGLPSVEHGDEPRVQQQVVPLSFGAEMPQPDLPAEPAPPSDPAEENVNDDTELGITAETIRAASFACR